MPNSKPKPATPIPSATVIILREEGGSIQALMLRRNPELRSDPDHWVFPGGKLESDELAAGEAGYTTAAIRECEEEAGIRLDQDALIPLSRWITPDILPKRFVAFTASTT